MSKSARTICDGELRQVESRGNFDLNEEQYVAIIGNTIRLDIENRRSEIEVTKLVGGSDAFVRRPFLYNGVWYGLGGGTIAWLTVALVVLVIFLFLRNLSATVIPSLALPASIVATFAVMYMLGYSLDNLSLMALTLSVGFVVAGEGQHPQITSCFWITDRMIQ